MPARGVHSKTHDGMQRQLKVSHSHYDCFQCDKVYRKRYQLENHVRENHPNLDPNLICQPCNRIFRSEISLQDHYRGSQAHPTCVICGKGFKDRQLYEEHLQETHSRTTTVCAPCGDLELHKEELSKHYFESQNHPSCQTCQVGFLNDCELDKHSRMLHYETRCDQCQRQYDSMSDLQQHYLVSSKHPKCLTCGLGFPTETEEEKHRCTASPTSIKQADNNVSISTPSSNSPEFGSSPPESIAHNLSSGYSRRREKMNESTWSSLVFSEDALPSLITGSSESSFILAKEKWHAPEGSVLFNVDPTVNNGPSPITTIASSGPSDLISERALQPFQPFWPTNLLSPSPEVQSPMGLEPLPPSISPAVSTPVSQSTIAPAPKDPWSQWRCPIKKRPSLPRIATGIRLGEESAAIDNIRSSVSTSLDRDIVRHGFHKTHDYLLNVQVPDLSSPLPKNKVFHSKAVTNLGVLYEREYAGNDDAYSQYDTFQGSTSSPNFGSPKNDDRFSVTESSILSATTVSSASLHCRLCMRNPSVDTTATMCGHIFCGKCIADSVIVSPKCPVCQNALLLYCLFKLDLTT
ncbi:hypothetical protein BDP27DRAFT_1420934 [Rhodocollybia butyracea]|uniref:Uncharacterized protein n=1 Tax=Rhodocollybia butyracea TaxID=206335 RepID=A0A9P5PP20_9AGAR|nr:hypothetical protein BDP27DRAFT_1420934 [Rhodocollybia butyracea]